MRKLLMLCVIALICALKAVAAEKFVPRPYELTAVASTTNTTKSVYIADIFEFPDTIAATENLDTHGVTVDVTSDNEDLVSFKSYSWMSGYKKNNISLTVKANQLGDANVTVKLTYGGEVFVNVLKFSIVEVTASDMKVYATIGTPCKLDVLGSVTSLRSQHNVTKEPAENISELTIVRAPSHGSFAVDTLHYDRFNTRYYRQAVVYTPAEGLDNYTRDSFRFRITLASGNYAEAEVAVLVRKNALVSRIIEFLPAPGQFTNSGGSFNDASCLIGKGSSSGSSSVPQSDGLVSLGGFGGYVIVGFDQPIMNNPQNPYGVDFSIGGNSFVAAAKGVWTEPGAVMVSRDDNGNGLADDEWYELAGSDYWFSTSHRNITMTYTDPAYNKRYTVPWTTDNGMAGALLTNQFHEQPYFPDPAVYPAAAEKIKDGKLSFGGTLIRSSLDKRVPSYIEFYRCPAFGYCDNKPDNSDLTVARNPYYDDENGKSTNGFDISWAVDKEGNYVNLDHIDFVKIYTAGSVNAGWLGEWSTEVTGVGITNPDPDYVPKDYYLNYASITQLQVPVGGTCRYEGMAFKNGRPLNDGSKARWWVDDDAIGSIDDNGLFTGRTIGTTTVHFQQYADAPADEFDVEVVAMTGVMIDIEGNASTVSNDSISCIKGETIYINVESLTQNKEQLNGTSSNRYIYDNYSWINSNPAVGTIDNGTFKALAEGETELVVFSGIDASLTDTIKVTVLPIPATQLVSDPVKVPYHAAKASYTNDKLFTTGNDARVNMLSVTSPAVQGCLSLENNVLGIDFSGLEFGRYPASFTTSAYGVTKDFDTAFDYYADNYGSERSLIVVYDDRAESISTESGEKKSLDVRLTAGQATDVATQGAYMWVAKGANVSRYNVSKGEKVAETTLSAAGTHSMALYADRLIVSDGTILRRYYKTDLEPCGSIDMACDVDAVASDGTYAYVLAGNKVLKISLDGDMTLAGETEVNADGLSGRMYCAGDSLMIPSGAGTDVSMTVAYGGETTTVAGADAESSGISFYDGLNGRIGVLDITGHVHWFGTVDGGWIEEPESALLAGTDYAGAKTMAIMEEIGHNVAPVVKNMSSTTVYEYATSRTSSLKQKTTFCTDQENSYDIYPRIPSGSGDWLESVERYDNGNIRVNVKFTGTVDADSIVSLPVECIDHAGASVMNVIPYKISPRIYKPLIKDYAVDGVADTDFEHTVNLADVFVNQGAASVNRYYTCTNEIVANSLPDNVTVTLDGDQLKVGAPAGTVATGDIKVARTIAHSNNKTYLPKTFATVIPVNISGTSGIDDVISDGLGIYPNPAVDNVTVDVTVAGRIEIFTIGGIRVLCREVVPGEPVSIGMLPAGTYLVRTDAGGEVRTAKLIKL